MEHGRCSAVAGLAIWHQRAARTISGDSNDTRRDTQVVQTLNSAFDTPPLIAAQLTETFNMWWGKLEAALKSVPPTKALVRDDG